MSKIWTYQHKTKITFGAGALEKLPEEVVTAGGGPVLIVADPAMRAIGALSRVEALLSGVGVAAVYDSVSPNPEHTQMDECAALALSAGCKTIVGIGGGSTLDVAKASAVIASNGGPVMEYLVGGRAVSKPAMPVIAIPTTAGTGSEVNPFMVATDSQKDLKLAFAPEQAFPRAAVLDPELLLTLPKRQTASTGVDALSHALEAYWAKRAQPVSDINALEAVRLSFRWLPTAFENGSNIAAREKTMLASLLASLAFSSTGTCACHSISYPLTARYGLDHGFACAFTMPEILEWNWEALGEEKQNALLAAMEVPDGPSAVAKLRDFCASLGTPQKLSDIGVKPEDLESIPALTAQRNLDNTLCDFTKANVIDILKQKF
ncbi:MAG: NAD-dependent methanol dehydrogenase [bacterium ADurb.Bin236]|nr:MAG: NAD-dependent methanol dehydrogenase [bacterium ADurb.Bin236]HOY64070.1 iron-containing alcohol dehydrogenase [bacterium]